MVHYNTTWKALWVALSKIGTNVANPTDKGNINGGSEQIQLTNMPATVEHICQLDLRGTADYMSSSVGFATLDNLRSWTDNHLHTIEYSVQVKYKGNV